MLSQGQSEPKKKSQDKNEKMRNFSRSYFRISSTSDAVTVSILNWLWLFALRPCTGPSIQWHFQFFFFSLFIHFASANLTCVFIIALKSLIWLTMLPFLLWSKLSRLSLSFHLNWRKIGFLLAFQSNYHQQKNWLKWTNKRRV